MKFKKGESGNPEGKPKGAKNIITKEGREIFMLVMKGEVEHIKDNLELLREDSPEKYLKALSALFPYFMPKQNDIEITYNEPKTAPSWFADVLEREDQKDSIE
jgi:hypothetical protein|tara:strand:- start:113 stop:421 length:309 start_codon:yes stop_codon:yes gene_type:complete